MQAFKRLVILAGAIALNMSALAAGLETTRPMTGQLLVTRGEVSVITRVEYCLRNMPGLTEPLVAAHATYSRAAADAAAILERQAPASKVTIQRARIETSSQVAAEFDMKQARSMGFNRLCPELITYMRSARGDSLAKQYGDMLSGLQKQFSSP